MVSQSRMLLRRRSSRRGLAVVSVAQPVPSRRRRWSPFRAFARLTPAEGWASVLLLAVIALATAWTVARTEVAPDGVSMAALAIGGLLVGLTLAKLSTPDLLAHLFAILSGLLVSFLLAVGRTPRAAGDKERCRERCLHRQPGEARENRQTQQSIGDCHGRRCMHLTPGMAQGCPGHDAHDHRPDRADRQEAERPEKEDPLHLDQDQERNSYSETGSRS